MSLKGTKEVPATNKIITRHKSTRFPKSMLPSIRHIFNYFGCGTSGPESFLKESKCP